MALTTNSVHNGVHKNGTYSVAHRTGEGFSYYTPPSFPSPTPCILAIPASFFIRRRFPKPFHNIYKLRQILDGLLRASLFQTGDTPLKGASKNNLTYKKYKSFLSIGEQERPTFSSFQVDEAALHALFDAADTPHHPILKAVPEPFGLAWFCETGQAAVVVCEQENGVLAALVDAQKNVLDFRFLPQNQWAAQSLLTLRAWAAWIERGLPPSHADGATGITVLRIGRVALDEAGTDDFIIKNSPLPQGVSSVQAAAYGLSKLSEMPENFQTPEASAPLFSRTGHTLLETHAVQARPWLGALCVLVVVSALGLWTANGAQLRKMQAMDAKVSTLFESALPGTPMIDAPLQLERRLDELFRLTGQASTAEAPLAEALVTLYQHMHGATLAPELQTLRLEKEKLYIAGTLPELEQVDTLQNILAGVMPAAQINLQNVRMNEGGGAAFTIEASTAKGGRL